jgi:dCMP deaminase
MTKLTKWDHRFLAMTNLVAGWSKDRSTHVGAVIVGRGREVISTGYNGFPRGTNDDVSARHERPAKYLWTEHAERNAIYNAARRGIQTDGATMYLLWFPCADCARAIIQSGIAELVAEQPNLNDPRWGESFVSSMEMLTEAGVTLRLYDPMEENHA